MASRITDLLAIQAEELARMQEDQARRMLRHVQQAAAELRAELATITEATPYTLQHRRVMLAQCEAAILRLRERLDATLVAGARLAGERALRDLLSVIRANEPDFRDAGNRIEYRALSRLTEPDGLLLHRYSTQRYTAAIMEAVQRDMAVGIFRGQSVIQVAARIASTVNGTAWRGELIARMETNAAYNSFHQQHLEIAASELDDPEHPEDRFMRQMSEFIDHRNNPFSRAADGVVAHLSQPWMVSVAKAEEAARTMKLPLSGILWPREGAYYVGSSYPAHFTDRGRMIPYRASWDNGAALAKMRPNQLLPPRDKRSAA